jgi:hypothetical protein
MSKLRRKFPVALVAVVGVVAFAGWLLVPRPGIDRGTFERIQEGMTQAEVEAILGVERRGRRGVFVGPVEFVLAKADTKNYRCEGWWSDAGCVVEVYFDAYGVVVDKQLTEYTGSASFLRRVRRALGLG